MTLILRGVHPVDPSLNFSSTHATRDEARVAVGQKIIEGWLMPNLSLAQQVEQVISIANDLLTTP